MYKTLDYQVQKGIAKLTFNRPQSLNSLDEQMAVDLKRVWQVIAADDSIKIVVLRGADKAFMAGGDVGYFYQKLDQVTEIVSRIIVDVHEVIKEMRASAKIIIASVHGAVAGIGVSFMLAADLVVAADSTQFTLAYSKIGTSPDGGASFHLPRTIGAKKAMELLLLSDRIDAETALALGLLNQVVPDAELAVATERLALRLATGPSIAYGNIKQLLNQSWQNTLEQQLQAEAEAFIAATLTKDFNAGVTAFVKKTEARFTGA